MDYEVFKARVLALAERSPSGITVTVRKEEGGFFLAEFSDGTTIIGRESEKRLSIRRS